MFDSFPHSILTQANYDVVPKNLTVHRITRQILPTELNVRLIVHIMHWLYIRIVFQHFHLRID